MDTEDIYRKAIMAKKRSGEMSFLDHLEELRKAILKSVVAIFVGMLACFFFSDQILAFLISPTRLENLNVELQYFRPAGMFMVRINVSLACGFALAMPVVLYQLWNFISPGLLENEKKYIPYVIFFSTLLFLLGAAFAFFVLIPVMIAFFVQVGVPGVKAQWDIGYYMGLIIKMVVTMGLVFEMPLLIGFLTWIRIVSPGLLRRSWRYALVIIFILAAVITPTGDPYTQILVAIPLIVLYFISMGVSMLVARGRGQEPEEPVTDDHDDEGLATREPETPGYARGLSSFTGPESAMNYWPSEDEFIFDYEKAGGTLNRPDPKKPEDKTASDKDDGSDAQENDGRPSETDTQASAKDADGDAASDKDGRKDTDEKDTRTG